MRVHLEGGVGPGFFLLGYLQLLLYYYVIVLRRVCRTVQQHALLNVEVAQEVVLRSIVVGFVCVSSSFSVLRLVTSRL